MRILMCGFNSIYDMEMELPRPKAPARPGSYQSRTLQLATGRDKNLVAERDEFIRAWRERRPDAPRRLAEQGLNME